MDGSEDMALNLFPARIIGRSDGGNAVRSIAYIFGQKLRDEQTGKLFDFTKKESRVEFAGVFNPKDAPEWMKDPAQYGNALERAENKSTRPDQAQLLREFIPTFPHELTAEQRRWMVTDFGRSLSRDQGLHVMAANHLPDEHSDQRNFHAHIYVNLREITPEGFGPNKFSSLTKTRKEWKAKETAQLEGWKAKWSELGAKQLERAGFQQEAERFRHGHKSREERIRLADERGDTDHADVLRTNAPNIHLGTKPPRWNAKASAPRRATSTAR